MSRQQEVCRRMAWKVRRKVGGRVNGTRGKGRGDVGELDRSRGSVAERGSPRIYTLTFLPLLDLPSLTSDSEIRWNRASRTFSSSNTSALLLVFNRAQQLRSRSPLLPPLRSFRLSSRGQSQSKHPYISSCESDFWIYDRQQR